MQSLKCYCLALCLFFMFVQPSLWAQRTNFNYLDVQYGGPLSTTHAPGPAIETGFFFTPQIGLGIRWETEPFNYFFKHGVGIQLRLSSQAQGGEGWHLSGSIGRGFKERKYKGCVGCPKNKPGYLFSEFSIGRHVKPRWIFSSGVRAITNYEDVPSRDDPNPAQLLTSKVTYVIGGPSSSTSPALTKLNNKTYFFGLYSINTRFFDKLRVNGMINMGLGWKLTPQVGLGASLVLNEGLTIDAENKGNMNKLTGVGSHILIRKDLFWGMLEVGAATKIVKGRFSWPLVSTFSYRQHTRATTPYGRIGLGIFVNKYLLVHTSFLIAPSVYGDLKTKTPGVFPAPQVITSEQTDLYFSYTDLTVGIGFMLE